MIINLTIYLNRQSIHTIQTTLFGIFHFLLDLIVPILILERVLDTESGDKQSEEVIQIKETQIL